MDAAATTTGSSTQLPAQPDGTGVAAARVPPAGENPAATGAVIGLVVTLALLIILVGLMLVVRPRMGLGVAAASSTRGGRHSRAGSGKGQRSDAWAESARRMKLDRTLPHEPGSDDREPTK